MEPVKKNTKFIVQNEDYFNRDEYEDSEYEEDDETYDMEKYEYVITSIQNCLIDYVSSNYIQLCEYLTCDKIDEFLSKNL